MGRYGNNKPPVGSYWRIPLAWEGETCFILGTGASLLGFGAECLRGLGRVIAVRTSYMLAPWADVLYFSDCRWLNQFRSDISVVFSGDHIITVEHPKVSGVKSLHLSGRCGLSRDRGAIADGGNDHYAAINAAILFGAKRIALLGYDFRGEWCFDVERKYDQGFSARTFLCLARNAAERGVEILNCTPGSRLTCFRSRMLANVLTEERAKQRAVERSMSLAWAYVL